MSSLVKAGGLHSNTGVNWRKIDTDDIQQWQPVLVDTQGHLSLPHVEHAEICL